MCNMLVCASHRAELSEIVSSLGLSEESLKLFMVNNREVKS